MAMTNEELAGREALTKWIVREEELTPDDLNDIKVWQERLLELVEELGGCLDELNKEDSERDVDDLKYDFEITLDEVDMLLRY